MPGLFDKDSTRNPPGIRLADGKDEGRSCGSCQYFYGTSGRSREGDGECTVGREAVPARMDFVCDLHEPQDY